MKKHEATTAFQLGVRPKTHEFMIGSLVNQIYAVSEDRKIRELSDELKRVDEVWAVAVVDDHGKALGIIVTTQFQERMSRPFAHDVLDKKSVVEVMTRARTFRYDKHIFSVSDELAEEVQETSNHYYLVDDGKDRFYGIFSSKDLLIHQFKAHLDDVETAIKIQQSVVPEAVQYETPTTEIYAQSRMAKGVGGDFVAVRDLGDEKWLLSVCDVSGKGIGASLVTATLGGLFAAYSPAGGLAGFVSQVNESILSTYKMEKYLTGAFLEFDSRTGAVLMADMGHTYVGILRGSQVLKTPPLNPFVGFLSDLSVQTTAWVLVPGDVLFVYTDGFPEQKNVSEEEFGVEALETLLLEHKDMPLDDLADLVHHKVKKFRGDQPRGDDEAILLVRFIGPLAPGGQP